MHSPLVLSDSLSFFDGLASVSSIYEYVELVRNVNCPKVFDENGNKLEGERFWAAVIKAANYLKDLGAQAGDVVGVCMRPSIQQLLIVYGSMYLGCVYLPLSKNHPRKRIKKIITICGAKIVFTDGVILPINLQQVSVNLKSLLNHKLAPIKKANINCLSPAYIQHTSGSTGTPKCILVSQGSIINHMRWLVSEFEFDALSNVVFRTPLIFDPSVWEILTPIFSNASLFVYSAENNHTLVNFYNYLKKYAITHVQMVPTLYFSLLNKCNVEKLSSLKTIFLGGEELSKSVVGTHFKYLPAVELVNLYGPAECTIDTTFHQIKSDRKYKTNTIGKPIANCNVLLIDKNKKPILEKNEVGQIVISGAGVALKYLGENVERLRRNIKVDGDILAVYFSGDYAYINEDGNLVFTGRKDSLIKLNGARVDLREIKEVVSRFGVLSCVLEKRKNSQGYEYLAAKVLPRNESTFSLEALKIQLFDFLPKYMLPKTWTVVSTENRLTSGKINWESRRKCSLKENEIHERLRKIWCEVLGRPIAGNGNINFFELGGSSMAFLQLYAEIVNVFSGQVNQALFLSCYDLYAQADLLMGKSAQSLPKDDSIVCISASNPDAPNVILFHPIGGTIFWYSTAFKGYEMPYNIFAVQDVELLDPKFAQKILSDSVEELAEKYYLKVKHMLTNNAVLGGASFGATIAVEVARIARANGVVIQHVFSFDGWAKYPNEFNLREFKKVMYAQQQRWSTEGCNAIPFSFGQKYFDVIFERQLARLSALKNYYPVKTADLRLHLFKPEETYALFSGVESDYNYYDNYFSKSAINVIPVPGDHESMFSKENSEELRRCFIMTLNAILRDSVSNGD